MNCEIHSELPETSLGVIASQTLMAEYGSTARINGDLSFEPSQIRLKQPPVDLHETVAFMRGALVAGAASVLVWIAIGAAIWKIVHR